MTPYTPTDRRRIDDILTDMEKGILGKDVDWQEVAKYVRRQGEELANERSMRKANWESLQECTAENMVLLKEYREMKEGLQWIIGGCGDSEMTRRKAKQVLSSLSIK